MCQATSKPKPTPLTGLFPSVSHQSHHKNNMPLLMRRFAKAISDKSHSLKDDDRYKCELEIEQHSTPSLHMSRKVLVLHDHEPQT
jgi:hypothetical protein